MSDNSPIRKYIEASFKHIGLGDYMPPEDMLYIIGPDHKSASAFLRFEIPLNLRFTPDSEPLAEDVAAVFRQVVDNIKKSPAVKPELLKLTKEIEELKKERDSLQEKIEQLNKYKVYYDMELRMRGVW